MKGDLKFFNIGEVAEIFAGGDKPDNFNLTKTNEHQIPVFANGETNKGLQGFTNKAKVTQPAVTVSARGTIGYAVLRNEPFVPIVRLLTLIPNSEKLDIGYLYYYLSLFRQVGLGSSQAQLTVPDISNRKISIRNLSTQKAIGTTLALLDKKIEINNKINAELEKTAKTIYDYWFVQFDFPDKNGKPYKSSGGKMVWNEDLKREIPIGWRSDLLKNRLKSYLGGTPRRNNEEYWNNGSIPWLSSGEVAEFPILSSAEKITDSGLKNSAAKLLRVGSLMISITGNIRVSILGMDASANQSVVGIEENEELKKSYLYLFILNHISQYEALMTGAVQKHINKEVIDKTLLLIPSKEVLNMYYKLADSLFEKIIKISKENKELSELRDFLLPMLMNGQVKIS